MEHEWYRFEKLGVVSDAMVKAIETNPLHMRPSIKYLEAEPMRKELLSVTTARLASLNGLQSLAHFPEVEPVSDIGVGPRLWLMLMRDFYMGVPTDRASAAWELKTSPSTLERFLKAGREAGSFICEKDPKDARRMLIFPSLMLLLTYELVVCPAYFNEILVLRKRTSTLALIKEWAELRRRYMPENLKFKVDERQDAIKLELVS